MDSIKIFSVIDEKYVSYMGVLISNIKSLSSKEKLYEYIVVHKNMPDKEINTIEKMSSKNFRVRTLNISKYLENIKLPLDKKGEGIFYRIFAPSIFSQYDKILYLDIDLVVLEDIANLYEKNIDKYELAAVNDIFIINKNTNTFHKDKYCKHIEYYNEELSMFNLDKYFNSGIMLMNLKLMRQNHTEENIISMFDKYSNLLYHDQDFLNKYYYDKRDRVLFLDCSYNFLNEFIPYQNELSQELYEQYIQAKQHIKIRHYVSPKKPWNNWNCPNGIYWWKYGIRQPHLLLNLFKSSILRKIKLTWLMLICR